MQLSGKSEDSIAQGTFPTVSSSKSTERKGSKPPLSHRMNTTSDSNHTIQEVSTLVKKFYEQPERSKTPTP